MTRFYSSSPFVTMSAALLLVLVSMNLTCQTGAWTIRATFLPRSSAPAVPSSFRLHSSKFASRERGMIDSSSLLIEREPVFEEEIKKCTRWDRVKKALLGYKQRKGDLLVPRVFTVPEEDASWEADTRGVKLGYVVEHIRNRDNYKQHRRELIEMGFDYTPQMTRYGWELVKKALIAYKRRKGDLNVPFKFKIDDASWEADLRGLNLGFVVNHIRNHNDYDKYREELEEMGFNFSSQQGKGRRRRLAERLAF